MIVVDANVLVYLIIQGEHTIQAEIAYNKDSNWIAPFLWRSEVCNVIAGYMRKKLVTLEEAINLFQKAEQILKYNEYLIPSENVLLLVERSKCSAYDCEYVALAKQFDITLVTTDKLILSEFPEDAISLEKFVV
ncbi:MAG: type II toxin-antitoxin system VapC family toxin [Bacteroidota bacterium]